MRLLPFLLLLSLSTFAQNQQVSTGLFFDGEPFLTVNPQNPQHFVVCWMGLNIGQGITIKTRTTFDGGATWSSVVSLPHAQSDYASADPSLAFDTNGDVVACYIDYINEPTAGGIYFVKSNDGGLSWSPMTLALDAFVDELEYPIDRPWFSINPITNHYYLTSMSANWSVLPNKTYFAQSADDGATWSDWSYLDAPGFLVGDLIQIPMVTNATAPDGVFHAMYPSYVVSQNFLPGFILASSSDHGETFTYQEALFGAGGNGEPLAKSGYRLAADPSNAQHLAFVFIYSLLGDPDVYLIETTNGGESWSTPQRVNDDPAGNDRLQDLTWAAFDNDGDLAIAWRDRRNAPTSGYATSQEIYGAVKWNGSQDISANFPISSEAAPYNATLLESSGNDFLSVTMLNDTMSVAWGDVRNNKLDIWFQRINAQTGETISISEIASETAELIRLYPMPANQLLFFEGPTVPKCEAFTEEGKWVQSWNKPSGSLYTADLATGVYLFRFYTLGGNQTLRVVIEH